MPTETFALRGQTVIITSHGVHAPVDGDPGWVIGRLREGQQDGRIVELSRNGRPYYVNPAHVVIVRAPRVKLTLWEELVGLLKARGWRHDSAAPVLAGGERHEMLDPHTDERLGVHAAITRQLDYDTRGIRA